MSKVSFVWHADVMFTGQNGEVDTVYADNSATVTGDFTEEDIERGCLEFIAEQAGVPVSSLVLVSFSWSSV